MNKELDKIIELTLELDKRKGKMNDQRTREEKKKLLRI